MKKILAGVVTVAVAALLFTGCASMGVSRTGQEGAGIGAVMGGITGAVLDHKNAWRGGVLGAAAGALIMGTVGELSYRGAMEAAETGRTVQYRTNNGAVYQAVPGEYDAQTHCRKVHERVWNGDNLVKDSVKEVCESTKDEAGY